MLKFVELRAKTYSYLRDDGNEDEKKKKKKRHQGTQKKCVAKKNKLNLKIIKFVQKQRTLRIE